MPRQILVQSPERRILREEAAADELELQELIKRNSDLLPIEEFGCVGPGLVVGRETVVQSGAVDLVMLARGGELLVVEFKTGPKNTDFRRVIAQLLDYGAMMWGRSYEEFEASVVVPFYRSKYAVDLDVKNSTSIVQAALRHWVDFDREAELSSIRDKVTKQLQDGAFSYVAVAQRFTDGVLRTAEYVNEVMSGPRLYCVELVRFASAEVSAFECRTVLKPSLKKRSAASHVNEEIFFDGISDADYEMFLRRLFEEFRNLGLVFEWGAVGVSVRVPINEQVERTSPYTIAWAFPPGRTGWMDLENLAFGYDAGTVMQVPKLYKRLREFDIAIGQIPGAIQPKTKNLSESIWQFSPHDSLRGETQILDALRRLIEGYTE